MDYVSVAELKARLSRYLGRVKEGETVYITSHRRPVAKLSPSQVDESLQVQPPELTMDQLKNVSVIRPAAGVFGLEELLEDRGRR